MLVPIAYAAALAISLAVVAAVALRSMWLAALLGAIEASILCLVGLIASLRRQPRADGVVQVHATDAAVATDGVVIQLAGAIEAVSTMSATIIRSIAPGAGGGSAILGSGGLIGGHGAGHGGSALLGFHSEVMDRLATGDYPTVNRSLY